MNAITRIPIPIYLAELVIIHCTFDDLIANATLLPRPLRSLDWASEKPCDGFADVVGGFAKPGATLRRYAYLYIDTVPPVREKQLTIVHESAHLAVRLMSAIEQDITATSDEPFAYLLEWITREAWKACGL